MKKVLFTLTFLASLIASHGVEAQVLTAMDGSTITSTDTASPDELICDLAFDLNERYGYDALPEDLQIMVIACAFARLGAGLEATPQWQERIDRSFEW